MTQTPKFRVAELFAGVGGFRLGLERSGWLEDSSPVALAQSAPVETSHLRAPDWEEHAGFGSSVALAGGPAVFGAHCWDGTAASVLEDGDAVNVFGRRFGLPPAVGVHNNYWVWGPGVLTGAVMIIVGGEAEDYHDLFNEVTEAARFENPYVMPYENNLPIFVCRDPKGPIKDVWLRNKQFI